MQKDYYTVDQVAAMLAMHPKTIQRYIREGKLRAAKVGKSWRITGHDLSVFTEGEKLTWEDGGSKTSREVPVSEKIKISAVMDVEVRDMEEAMRISNMLNAVLNVKPPEYAASTMHVQFLGSERKIRIMLWGNARFMEFMIQTVTVLASSQTDEEEKT